MTPKLREAQLRVLVLAENCVALADRNDADRESVAIVRAALVEPEREPCAWVCFSEECPKLLKAFLSGAKCEHAVPMFDTPPAAPSCDKRHRWKPEDFGDSCVWCEMDRLQAELVRCDTEGHAAPPAEVERLDPVKWLRERAVWLRKRIMPTDMATSLRRGGEQDAIEKAADDLDLAIKERG